MSTAKHIINKQTLNITLSPDVYLHNIQDQLGYICRQILPTTLEQVCDAVCAEDYWIKLGKISIDLGGFPAADLEEKMHKIAGEKLTEALLIAIGRRGDYSKEAKPQKKSFVATVDLLTYFLAMGTLPVWVDSSSITLEQLLERTMATNPKALRDFLRHPSHKGSLFKRLAGIVQHHQLKTLAVLLTDSNAFDTSIDVLFDTGKASSTLGQEHLVSLKESILFYLIHYGSGRTLSGQHLLNTLAGSTKKDDVRSQKVPEKKSEENNSDILVEVVTFFLATGVLPEWVDSRSVIPEQLFERVMATTPEAIYHFLRHVPHKDNLCKRLAGIVQYQQLKMLANALTHTTVFDPLIDVLSGNEKTVSTASRVAPIALKAALLSYIVHFDTVFLEEATAQQKTLKKTIIEHIKKGNMFKAHDKTAHKERSPQPISMHPCTIHNSGLVLLWPGIPSLLETCALTRNGSFINEAAAERAVLLLQYAVDGRTEIPEFELPLNKILCGLTTDTPVATVFDPTATEKAAVRELLERVITEWGALKGSSPEVLQVNYLQREGKLTPRSDYWQLDLERQTADVLLDRLPWGIGVVKLPWMNHIVYTTW
ncbi:MAG: contractile injection system tape measure protein [Bacteroidota bacterium]